MNACMSMASKRYITVGALTRQARHPCSWTFLSISLVRCAYFVCTYDASFSPSFFNSQFIRIGCESQANERQVMPQPRQTKTVIYTHVLSVYGCLYVCRLYYIIVTLHMIKCMPSRNFEPCVCFI